MRVYALIILQIIKNTLQISKNHINQKHRFFIN